MGQVPPKGPKRNQYLLQRNDGTQATVEMKFRFPDPAPTLLVDGQTVQVAPQLSQLEIGWAAWPIIMMFFGGAVGGLCGGAAAALNLALMRSDIGRVARYVVTACISLSAVMLWLIVKVLLERR